MLYPRDKRLGHTTCMTSPVLSNPTTGETGGSPDGRNHYWGLLATTSTEKPSGSGRWVLRPTDFEGNDIGASSGSQFHSYTPRDYRIRDALATRSEPSRCGFLPFEYRQRRHHRQ